MINSKLIEEMTEWRRRLHSDPEIGLDTPETAAFVADKLRSFGYDVTEGIGGFGVVGRLKKGSDSRSIGFRSDMDALKINEQTGLPYASHNGYMHACGHDGHMAMLLGAASEIAGMEFNGTLNLIFQPAEEPTTGAKAMIGDGLFERFPMDEIYGLHNAPFHPLGTICTRTGGLMSSEDNFRIIIHGKGCHASSPHEGSDPFLCFSQIYPALQAIVSRNASPAHCITVSCTEISSDGVRNAIPNTIEVRGDVRCFSPADQTLVEKRMREICESVCSMNGASAEVEYTHECASVQNDAGCAANVCEAAGDVVGEEKTDGACDLWMASEDFSAYLEHVPGCLFLLGTGKSDKDFIPLHSPLYDFCDEVLPVGAEMWKTLAQQRLK